MTIGLKNDHSLWKSEFRHRSELNHFDDKKESWASEIGGVVSTSIYRLKDYKLALTGVIVAYPITDAGDLSKSNRARYWDCIEAIYDLRWLSDAWESRSNEPEPPVLSVVLIEPGSAEKDGKQPTDGDDAEALVRGIFGTNDLDTLPKIYRLRQSDGTSAAAIVDDLVERSIQRKRIAKCRDRRPPSILDVEKEDLSMCNWYCHVHNLFLTHKLDEQAEILVPTSGGPPTSPSQDNTIVNQIQGINEGLVASKPSDTLTAVESVLPLEQKLSNRHESIPSHGFPRLWRWIFPKSTPRPGYRTLEWTCVSNCISGIISLAINSAGIGDSRKGGTVE